MNKDHLALGRQGEKLARKFLKKAGFRMVEANYRGRLGEIDLVAEDEKCLVFIEVKTRSSLSCGHPLEGIGPRKQHQLIKTAMEYLAEHGCEERICRFDAVSVLFEEGQEPRIELVRNAFELSGQGG